MNKVSLRNVSKVYNVGEKEYRALDHVDLDIEEGKFVVILGPSGAGKSTLLNLIGGMDTPTEGEVIVNGENITGYSENKLSDFRAESVGFIFQFYNILPFTYSEPDETIWMFDYLSTCTSSLISCQVGNNSVCLSLVLSQKIQRCYYVTNQQELLILRLV